MAAIGKMLVEWTGGAGLPGVSVLYNDGTSTAAVADLVTFFTAIADRLPTGISVVVPSSGDTIDDGNGQLLGEWSGGAGGTINGIGSGSYAAGVGVAVQWNTVGIRNGRRVRGRTFLCPLEVGAYDPQGTISTAARSDIQAAATALATAGNLVVFSRPSGPGASDGDSFAVTSAYVPDRVTSLRTRRY